MNMRSTRIPYDVPAISPKSPFCATPACTAPRGHGEFGCFCQSCAGELARIRAEMEGEKFRGGRRPVDELEEYEVV